MMFVYDEVNKHNPINLQNVVGILAPDTATKDGRFYILFYTPVKNFFWFYSSKEERDVNFEKLISNLFNKVPKCEK